MTTVLAHGCFDLLHIGHIRHLQEARAMGSKLIVSVTADEFVDKGIGRPHFRTEQRVAALKALACVDEVVVSNERDAADVITQLRPGIYVKGIDYKAAQGERLAKEKSAIEAVGGKLMFTSTEKFSSSRLINSEKFTSEVLQYLADAREAGWRDQIFKAFEEADRLSIAFVGECIIDEYRYVKGLGRASKELMLATVEVGREEFNGGAAAAYLHGEWKRNDLITVSSQIKKTRLVDSDFNRKLFDVYSAQKLPITELMRDGFREHLGKAIDTKDVVVVLDFGHGLLEPEDTLALGGARFLAVNAQTNAGNYGYNLITKYTQADFICIDDPEARLAASMAEEPISTVMSDGLCSLIDCNNFLTTHGRFGSYHYSHHDHSFGAAPPLLVGGIDTIGAGDAVMAVTAPLVAAGLGLGPAALVGNVAGAIKTSIVGHRRHVGRQEIVTTIEALLA